MVLFKKFIRKHFYISFLFLFIGLLFGLSYALNLLGVNINSQIFTAYNLRSVHISLMLYGFVPLLLSFLPFFLIVKEVNHVSYKGLAYLEIFVRVWYLFLIFMIVTLLFGNHRGLAFYDFPYVLNFILAFSGIFYILALLKFLSLYEKLPLWVKVSRIIVLIAPLLLLLLMNPKIGQVEQTINGPQGDNTLGMSFALIPLYYLIFKYLNEDEFKARWNLLWMIPLLGYIMTILYRVWIGSLSYNWEWVAQYLTLLYIPLLYRWYKDSVILEGSRKLLRISIVAFLFVDIEGNILFIPQIRWIFHRNDLVVAHAHIALGVGVLFMILALFSKIIEPLQKQIFSIMYIIGMLGILFSLSYAGFIEAGLIDADVWKYWLFRLLFAFFVIGAWIPFFRYLIKWKITPLVLYHIIGLFSDLLGGFLLFLFADFLYPLLGFGFAGGYQYVVFAFMMGTGIVHLFGLIRPVLAYEMAEITAYIRIVVAAFFFSLFLNHTLDSVALVVSIYDFVYAVLFLWFVYQNFIENSQNSISIHKK